MKQHIAQVGWAIAVAALVWTGGDAAGQRLLVRTASSTATGDATGSHLTSVDMARGEALPTVEALPGSRAIGPLALGPDASLVFATSSEPYFGGAAGGPMLGFLSAFGVCPFGRSGLEPFVPEMGWEISLGPVFRDNVTEATSVVVFATKQADDGTWQGRAHVVCADVERTRFVETASYPLPGAPVGAAAIGDGRAAFLCRGSLGTGSYLSVIDIAGGEMLVDAQEVAGLEERRLGNEPIALTLTADGAYLTALTTGYALDRPSGNAFTVLHCWSLPGMEPAGEPLALPGVPDRRALPVQPGHGAACWVATFAPGEGFAYATRIAISGDGLTKTAEPSFTRASGPPLIASDPAGPSVAIAVGQRVDIMDAGTDSAVGHDYAAAIGALVWTARGLFVGEGGRVHCVEPGSGAPSATVQLQSGLVTDIALVPEQGLPAPDPDADGIVTQVEAALGTDPRDNDTDDDGLHDGVDPEPKTPSPRLSLPAAVVFREEAAGRELRAVQVDPAKEGSAWRLAFDEEAMPWLSVYPRSGPSPVFYLGVDPSRYEEGTQGAFGELTVHASGTDPALDSYGSPARIGLWIRPKRTSVRRILWLLKEQGGVRAHDDVNGMRGLAEMLAGPPHYFSHHESTESYLQSLDPYSIVVLAPEAVLRGAVTRQAILNYVARGGGLLFLASHLEEEAAQSLTRWLSPVGIHFAPAERVEGRFPANRSHWLSRFWKEFTVSSGAAMRIDDSEAVVVPGTPGSGISVLALQRYGYGRIVALASPSVLETGQMWDVSNRRFAEVLFRWLAGSGRDIDDLDGDTLPDGVEDKNRNAAVDPGETSALDPDSDGDGLPDGMEDMNRNGKVDPGETSPINPDSDGDEVWDGADEAPLPSIEAPHIAGTEPSTGPAEGGTQVLISGRNLFQDSAVWFGPRRSPRVRSLGGGALFAESPACESEEGGAVDVRIESPSVHQEGLLPGGFFYTPVSEVNLTLERIRAAESTYHGMIALRAECEPDVKIGWITLRIDVEPSGVVSWGDLAIGSGAERTGRQVTSRPSPTGGLWVDISPGVREWRALSRRVREMATIRWESTEPLWSLGAIRLSIARARAMSANGVPLRVVVKGVPLHWEPPA